MQNKNTHFNLNLIFNLVFSTSLLKKKISFCLNRDSKNNQILAAAYNVISGKHSPLDLIRVKCDRKTYYSFLSIGWGLLSDIDIESESLRLLGGHRFSVWAIVRALGIYTI